ncbi:MAG: PSD1 and planctomycete cytochrome C domain-containing protein [Pirellulales bacterium]
MRSRLSLVGSLGCGVILCGLAAVSTAAEPVDYLREIKPVLAAHCYACHGALKQEGGLRLDTVASLVRGGDSGPGLIRRQAAESRVWQRVSASGEQRMPPPGEGEPLQPAQLARLREWIDGGAAGPAEEQPEANPLDHWAYRPRQRPPLPPLAPTAAWRGPVDAFLAEAQRRRGVTAAGEAPWGTQIRRLYLDLVGVPPTFDDLATQAENTEVDAYERLVDRLLADPRHGERWGRHWMDVWRYSDWWGLGDQLRNSQKHIWHWRDWIIEAVNQDVPYDEMVRQMLAADEMYPQDLSKVRATGYLARNYFLFNRHQWMDETVEHVGKAFLGLTLNCAKCHEHKYDPISQAEYYRLRAFFEPYHVRLDVLPGEADLTRDGLPRVFDGQLEQPTYRLIRGQESQPDTSQVMTPDVPEWLRFAPLEIRPVTLPADAWQPERRPWVAEAHRAAAERRVVAARGAVTRAETALEAARQQAAAKGTEGTSPPPPAVPGGSDNTSGAAASVDDPVARFDPLRWLRFGGEWKEEPGRLEQRRDGPQRAGLRWREAPPRDFDATIRFAILGGSQWRSVSLSFDVSSLDPAAEPAAGDSEQVVYVSAYAGGPKLQAAYQQGGQWQYPDAGRVARPIALGQTYTLRVRVRDTLINAELDGQPLLAFRTPLPRRAGALQLTTFDALAAFHAVTIRPLPADVVLREPTTAPAPSAGNKASVEELQGEQVVAQRGLELAEAELASLERRLAALQADWRVADSGEAARPPDAEQARQAAIREAVTAERTATVARAALALAEAELRQRRAAADKRMAADKEVGQAQEALQAAQRKLQEPGTQFAGLVGAQWTATRFRNSGQDDPAVTFPATSSGRRSALARWITDPRHPLTARVGANHVWLRHLGTALVPTVFDLGRKGAPPDHPELLDALATEWVDSGWSLKHLHRQIVTSTAYRRTSMTAGPPDSMARDPDNRTGWRRQAIRLESQVVRDALLSLAGKLDRQLGGPPVLPAQQAQSPRRSLYFFHSNNERNLFLTTFDEALVKECYRREQSIVPQQALALTNSQLVLDAAPAVAAQVTHALAEQGSVTDESFVRTAFVYVLGVTAGEAEVAASMRALTEWRAEPGANAEAARAQLVWVLLNHHDFVTLQ